MENEGGHDEADQNANEAVTGFIEIGVGCETLKHAEEKREGDLETGVADVCASGCDPAGNGADRGNEHDQRRDRFHVRNKEYDREKREDATDDTTCDS